MIEDIPTPIVLIFGGYILGAGYLALLSFVGDLSFKNLESFDKFMLSLVFGVLSFSLLWVVFGLNVNFADLNSNIDLLKSYSFFFLIQVFFARVLITMWVFIQHHIFLPSNLPS